MVPRASGLLNDKRILPPPAPLGGRQCATCPLGSHCGRTTLTRLELGVRGNRGRGTGDEGAGETVGKGTMPWETHV